MIGITQLSHVDAAVVEYLYLITPNKKFPQKISVDDSAGKWISQRAIRVDAKIVIPVYARQVHYMRQVVARYGFFHTILII